MKKFTLDHLTENIHFKDVRAERAQLVKKWDQTGLLTGLGGEKRSNMAQLFENQMAQIIKESASITTGGASLTSSGQIQGMTSLQFPVIRRVFANLVANELVSVQPMNLPSGLIFYMDYTYGSNVGGNAGLGLSNSATYDTYARGQSIYTNPAGAGIQSGSLAGGSLYDLVGTSFSKVHKSTTAISMSTANVGAFTGAAEAWTAGGTVASDTAFTGTNARFCGYDSKIMSDLALGTLDLAFVHIPVSQITSTMSGADLLSIDSLAVFGYATANGATTWGDGYQQGTGVTNLRKLNKRGNWNGTTFTPAPLSGDTVQVVIALTNGGSVPVVGAAMTASMAIADIQSVASTGAVTTLPSFESDFGTPSSAAIPEIDIKLESISITATTRKLRARWSPELAQDLNAYHSIDAEMELTTILSKQVALEIDREILADLLSQATGANYYWSRSPGKFVSYQTGAAKSLATSLSIGPSFTGDVQQWYQTFIETINAVSNEIHRKTLIGSANFIVVGPDVATILENSTQYMAKSTIDSRGQVGAMTIGASPVGTLTGRYTVYKDPYFPRGKVLVGYRGDSNLEAGYVYAPYVPLIVTQTIFGTEDFTPRKGVMTRYGKKMVRSDFFGSVTILDMDTI